MYIAPYPDAPGQDSHRQPYIHTFIIDPLCCMPLVYWKSKTCFGSDIDLDGTLYNIAPYLVDNTQHAT